jgi:hypothetical protein
MGVIKLTLPTTTTQGETRQIQDTLNERIASYLSSLQPEEDIELKEFISLAQADDRVLAAELDAEDFYLTHRADHTLLSREVKNGIISIEPFEKPAVGNLIWARQTQSVTIDITAIHVELESTFSQELTDLFDSERDSIEQAFQDRLEESIKAFFAQLEVGQTVQFNDFQQTIERLEDEREISVPASEGEPESQIIFTVQGRLTRLTWQTLAADHQTLVISTEASAIKDLPIRSTERAVLKPDLWQNIKDEACHDCVVTFPREV